jgi:hypothetical protein
MTAATLRQTAAAAAIEKKAVHMVPSSVREFHQCTLDGNPLTTLYEIEGSEWNLLPSTANFLLAKLAFGN